jgi:Kdo2-lipid IVA lauroyltransferase/acyltransferase
MHLTMKPVEKTFSYRMLHGVLKVAAMLPLWALYGLSDVVWVVLGFVVRYRRGIITANLMASFPDMSPKEIARIRRRFYRNFSDYIFETLKLLHISDRSMRRRMEFTGVEAVDRILGEGRPVVAFFSHCFNWEWVPSITLWSKLTSGEGVEFCQVYRPLRNRVMDALMLDIRSRFGSVSLTKKLVFLDLMRYTRRGIATITGFMSDQKPSHGDEGHYENFLHHPTMFITGTETVARRLDAAVVYFDMNKISRGHYRVDVRLITEKPGELPEGTLTDRYCSLLTQTIRRNPALWLWSHNRWKNPVAPR